MVETIANSAVNIGIVSYLQDKEKKLLQKAEQNDLHAEKLAEDERCVMLSTKNPLSEKEFLTKEDLRQLTLAYYSDLTDNISEFYRKYFNPERSIKNTQTWKKIDCDQQEIAYIEKELKEYLYDFN